MPESVSRSSSPRRPGRPAAVAAVDAQVDRARPIASWRNVARRFRSRSAPRPVFSGAGARRLGTSSRSTRSSCSRRREWDPGPTSSAAAARAALRSACGSACSRRGAGDAGPASAAGRSRTDAEAPAARSLPPLPPSWRRAQQRPPGRLAPRKRGTPGRVFSASRGAARTAPCSALARAWPPRESGPRPTIPLARRDELRQQLATPRVPARTGQHRPCGRSPWLQLQGAFLVSPAPPSRNRW